MNMQLRQCLARAKPFRLKKIKSQILTGIFDFQEYPGASKKNLIFKIWLQKCLIGNPARNNMRSLLLGRGNCCVTRPRSGPPWLKEEIRRFRFVVFLQFLAYYLILLDLQLNNFPQACTLFWEAPSRFPHFLQHTTIYYITWPLGIGDKHFLACLMLLCNVQ